MDTKTLDGIQTRAITLSFLLGGLILALKFGAWGLTGSSALLSDALESCINVAASAFAMWSLRLSRTPPDEAHPYGHGKAEFFSAMVEGALIAAAALAIAVTAFPKILDPEPLENLDMGLAVSVAASGVNLALGLYLLRTGKRTGSMILEADGRHLLTDVWTTGGVLAGLAAALWTGWLWMDGAIACVLAALILHTAHGLIRRAVKGLMHEKDDALIEEICRILNQSRDPSWVSVHKLRAWRSGRSTHIDMHLVLPRLLPFEAADAQVKRLENIFRDHFHGRADVLIKTEICEDRMCADCFSITCSSNAGQGRASPLGPQAVSRDAE
jgi:cation diffusion facilitator family transporter